MGIYLSPMGELKDLLPGRLRAARKAAKLTQKELADKIGAGRSSIALWESGSDESNITIVNIEKIAKACGVSPFYLVREKDNDSTNS